MKMTPDVQKKIISTDWAWTKSTTINFFLINAIIKDINTIQCCFFTKFKSLYASSILSFGQYQGWAALIFSRGPNLEVSENKGHMIAHDIFYYYKVICHQTYAVLIRMTIKVFNYFKNSKGYWKLVKGLQVAVGPWFTHPSPRTAHLIFEGCRS